MSFSRRYSIQFNFLGGGVSPLFYEVGQSNIDMYAYILVALAVNNFCTSSCIQ